MDKLEAFFKQQSKNFSDHDSGQLRRDVAYQRIKDAIQHAALEPGAPLSEMRLSKILGISRTPVREALHQLAQEGLVQVIPGQAVTVAARSMPDVLNVVHMRLLIEPELARLVAENASEQVIKALDEAVSRMEEAISQGDHTAWSRANNAYHRVMADACPNPLLGEIVVQMCSRVHHLANIESQTNPARLAECTREHRRIVDSIGAHDAAAAEQAMHDHIVALRESLFRRLSYGHH